MQRRTKAAAPPGMLDTQRISVDRYWRFAHHSMLIAIGLHGCFAVVGVLLDAPQLTLLQIPSIAVYATSYVLAKRGMRWAVTPLAWLDLLGHATAACWILGVDSGFQFYSWILMPLVFANAVRTLRRKLVMAMALTIIYMALDSLLRHHTPLVAVSDSALTALRYFNISCYLLTMGGMALAYARAAGQAESRLRATAGTDVLTGLLNRRRMSDHMESAVNRARHGHRPVSVVLLDIDEFKSINDRYGHGRGDEVIVNVGKVLSDMIRDTDVVARWGGEEFLILLPDTHSNDARDLSERIRTTIADTICNDDQERRPVTVTIGVATWSGQESLEDTIQRADKAMYRGKSSGRNRVVIDTPAALRATA